MKKIMLTVACLGLLAGLTSSANADIILYSNDGGTSFPFNTSVVADPFGTGMGDVLSVDNDFTGGGAFINVNTGVLDAEIAGYEGREWTLTYDIYSHIDLDDNAYSSLQGDFGTGSGAGTFENLDAQATWITKTRSGTFANTFTGASRILFVSNTQSTTAADEGETVPRYYLDNIVLSVAVPEPSSIAILGMIGGLFGLRRRKN